MPTRYFYPRPLRGGRLRKVRAKSIDNIFLSTPSARRATAVDGDRPRDVSISIHALCEEGDSRRTSSRSAFGYFYPRPLRGGRLRKVRAKSIDNIFLSTPSARRATAVDGDRPRDVSISIHALCEEGDAARPRAALHPAYFYPRPLRGGRRANTFMTSQERHISIHALCEEGDDYCIILPDIEDLFLSTPSARRATSSHRHFSLRELYFYPRPLRGGRPADTGVGQHRRSISIHALCEEGDVDRQTIAAQILRFLSTPSARRATAKTETKSLFSNKLYNILHEFRRALIYNGSKNYPNHAK